MNFQKQSSPLWYSVWFMAFSILLWVLILPLTRHGMFLDGVLYAAIAKNMSLGYGSLWQPFYSMTEHRYFYEHPPLALYFQSLFFKYLGLGFWVERLYSFLMAVGQFLLIAGYWLKKEKAPWYSVGLLLLFWVFIPLNYMYKNNLLECTLTLLTTAAACILLIKTNTLPKYFFQYIAADVAILLAFFCNGPTAFFPLAIPLINAWVTKESIACAFKNTLFLMLLLFGLFLGVYWFIPAAWTNTQHYLQQQLWAVMGGERELYYTGLKHGYILILYLRSYWFLMIFSIGLIAIAARIQGQSFQDGLRQSCKNTVFLLFLLLSFSAVLPIGLSHKQAFNYLLQSAPLFTLAAMYFCYPSVTRIAAYCKSRLKFNKYLVRGSFGVLVVSVFMVAYLANGYNRDRAMLQDIDFLSQYCKKERAISLSQSLMFQWYTGAYFIRQSVISMVPTVGCHYYLNLKNEATPEGYHFLRLPLNYYQLSERTL